MDYVFPFHDVESLNESENEFIEKKIEKQFKELFNLWDYDEEMLWHSVNYSTKALLICECRPFHILENLKNVEVCIFEPVLANKSFFVDVEILAQKSPVHYVNGQLFYDARSGKLGSCCSYKAREHVYKHLLDEECYDKIHKNLPKELVIKILGY